MEITGQVTHIGKRGYDWQITIRDSKDHLHNVTCEKYLEVFPGDAISGKIDPMTNVFIEMPIVKLFDNKDGIMNCLLKIFRKGNIVGQIYRYLENIGGGMFGGIGAVETLNHFSEQYRVDNENTVLTLAGGANIQVEDADKLLKWWVNHYLIRRLYLLGCTYAEIFGAENYGYNMTSLYQALMYDPLAVYCIKFETCLTIVKNWGIRVNPQRIELAKILRNIHLDAKNKGHTNIECKIDATPLIKEFGCQLLHKGKYLYMPHMANAEKTLSSYLHHGNYLDDYGTALMVTDLNKEQVEAMNLALKYRFPCIYGGPGTGKSTVIGRLNKEFESRKMRVCCTAFTGKAVVRLRKTGSRQARTLHSILKGSEIFDVLIIDEMSMVSMILLTRVIRKVYHKDIRIIFVGDEQQLSPIEEGDSFRELLKILPKVKLTQDCRRQDKGVLFRNIARIQEQKFKEFEWGQDMHWCQGDTTSVIMICKQLQSQGQKDVTVICPYKDPLPLLNKQLRNIWLGENTSFIFKDNFGNEWCIGDRIIMLENRYDINIMNGEEGNIIGCENNNLLCKFDDKVVEIPMSYPKGQREDMEHGPLCSRVISLSWAITVHKSQGSEWDVVVYFIPGGSRVGGFLSRRLSFTAMSRAKNQLYCVCPDYDIFSGSIVVPTPERKDNLFFAYQENEQDADPSDAFRACRITE